MLFAIICTDKPDGLSLRTRTRPQHVDYLRSLDGALKLAGPFMSDGHDHPIGSLVVVDAGSRQEAQRIADGDPYAKAGLFANVEIRPWNWTFGNPDAA